MALFLQAVSICIKGFNSAYLIEKSKVLVFLIVHNSSSTSSFMKALNK